MKIKKLLAAAVAMLFTAGAWAQTDVTNDYITNADFSSTDGWTAVVSGQFRDYGNGPIGEYNVRFSPATVDETHLATEYCFGFECRWQTNFASFTQETSELPIGVYHLSFDVENVNGSTKSANYANRFTVTVGGTTYTDTSTEWMSGKSAWTTHTIEFQITEASTATISLGYGTGNNNISADNTPALYVSHLKLTWTDPLEAAKGKLQEAIDAATGYNASLENSTLAAAISTAAGVKTSATTEEEITDAISTLNAAVIAAIAEANEETTVTTAFFVVNNSFETGDLTGWTANNASDTGVKANSGDTYGTSNGDGDYLFNTWGGSAAKYVKQTVSGLPEGYYTVTALVASDAGVKVTLYAGTAQAEVEASANGKTEFVEGSTPKVYVAADGSLEIGATSTSWYKVDNFRLTHYTVAVGAKEALGEAVTAAKQVDVTTNVGTAVFKKPAAAAEAFTNAIAAAEAVYNSDATAEEYKNANVALNEALEAWNNVTLNAPAEGQHFAITNKTAGYDFEGKTVTFIANSSVNGGFQYQYANDLNANYGQAFAVAPVEGATNQYYFSFVDATGNTHYITNGTKAGSTVTWAPSQIQTTEDAENALAIQIVATSVEDVWNLVNTESNELIGANNNINVYSCALNNDLALTAVEKAKITINTTAAGYGTIILPFAGAELPEGITANTVALDEDGKTLVLTPAETIEANKPYVLEGKGEGDVSGWGTATTATYTDGLLTGVYAATEAPVGSYVLQNLNEQVAFYQVREDAQPTVGANRAYLTVESSVKAFVLGGTTDAIQTVEAAEAENGAIYNLAGQRLQKAAKGVNIIKGKKVFIK